MTDYRASHLQPEKGKSYHESFLNDPYRCMVWQLEKSVLDKILTKFYKNSQIYHLDFACGTGRILSYLNSRVNTAVGADISPSMLEVARKYNRRAEIIEMDLTRRDLLGDRKFNMITAFRFFPNAEVDLRMEAMQLLARHLTDNGYLIFNNHMNTGSSRNRIARLFGRRGYKGMSNAEVKALLLENDLEIVNIYHLCVLPASDKHMLLPSFVLRPVEVFLSRWRLLRSLGENLIFVCRLAVTTRQQRLITKIPFI